MLVIGFFGVCFFNVHIQSKLLQYTPVMENTPVINRAAYLGQMVSS